jgi:DNA polymerase-3 subunit delta
MGSHLARLRRIAAACESGSSLAEALKASRVFWKEEREVGRQARVWTGAHIETVQGEITDADLACRQTGSPDELIGERLALAVAARARRLGL